MTRQELLDAGITSRSEARRHIDAALRHYRTAKRATIQVMADLRRLQDGGVHLLYGEQNFSIWAEHTFDGLAAANVRQLTRAGGVALELERRNLIDLDKPEGYVGTTGLRELSVVANDFGDDKMAEVFITARESVEDGKEVSGTAVKAALSLLMPPANPELVTPPALRDDDDEDDGYEEEKLPAKIRELVSHIQDLAWDLPGSADELAEANKQLQAELANESTASDETWIASKR
jgi:hypothetical protein